MNEEYKTKEQLIAEFAELHKKFADRDENILQITDDRDKAQKYLDIAGVIIVVIGSDKKIILINKKGCEILEYKEEEMIGKDWFETFIPERVRGEVKIAFSKLMVGEIKTVEYFENPVLTRKGDERLIAWHNTILRDDAGNITGTLSSGEDITERKRTEQTLLKSESRYRSLFENMLDGFAYCKMLFENQTSPIDFVYLEVNSAFERLTGLKNVVGKKVTEVIPGIKSYPEVIEICGRVALTGQPEKFEIDLKPLGAWLSVSVYSTEREYFVAVFDNITERKEAEMRLSLLASIIESSDDAIIGMALDGIILSWNLGAQRIYGYSADDVKSQSISILNPAHSNEVAQLLERIRQGQRIEHYETMHTRKDDKKIYVSLTISPIKDRIGKIIGASTIAWDVTEHKRIGEALGESEARFRSITQSATDAIISADSYDNIISWNKGAQTMFGYMEEEALGKSITIIIPERYRDAHKNGLERVYSTGETRIIGKSIPVELVGMRKDGSEFPLELSLSTWKTEKRRFYSAVIRDITERKLADEKLKKILSELERSNKDLEQFVYIASHDLQEPLRTVSNFSQLLGRRYKGKLDAKADQFIGFIVDGTTRMQQMIDDLLAYSRISTRAKPFEPTNCETIFDQALANVKMAIEESGALVTHDYLPTVMADSSQIIQLFQNLLSNAIKFRKEKPRIIVSAIQKGNDWFFSVKDNGIGIAPEFMENIFKMFEREHASAEYPGTGVGLAICKKIVERHGGRIWVESEQGNGSTFYFTIPVKRLNNHENF